MQRARDEQKHGLAEWRERDQMLLIPAGVTHCHVVQLLYGTGTHARAISPTCPTLETKKYPAIIGERLYDVEMPAELIVCTR